MASIHGYACFVAQVDPQKAAPLLAQVRRIFERHGKPLRGGPGPGGKAPGGGTGGTGGAGGGKAPEAPRSEPSAPEAAAPAKKKPFWKLF